MLPLKRPHSAVSNSSSDEDDHSNKRLKREKNRISAARSREKKSRMFQQMQEQIQVLTTKNGQLTRTLSLLTNQCQTAQTIQQENRSLREKIHALELESARLIAENAALQMQAGHSSMAGFDGQTIASVPPITPSHQHIPGCQNAHLQGADAKGYGYNEYGSMPSVGDFGCGGTPCGLGPMSTLSGYVAPSLPATGTETPMTPSAYVFPNMFDSSSPGSFDGTPPTI